jgi:hypothetical protein
MLTYPVLLKNSISLKPFISNAANHYAKRHTVTDAAYKLEVLDICRYINLYSKNFIINNDSTTANPITHILQQKITAISEKS